MSALEASTFELSRREVFGEAASDPEARYTTISLRQPVTLFVGRNGSGKSRVASAIALRANGSLRSTDRLVGIMDFVNWGAGWAPLVEGYRGVPLGDQERNRARSLEMRGTALDDMYALREQPEVALKVAAFIRRSLRRVVELHERAGFLDPTVRMGSTAYSLLRDEGHGLRELVVLLAAVYRRDWNLLVVDEPELHLHPSLARLWLAELGAECRATGRHAIVVTHQPQLVRPVTAADLEAIYLFQPARVPTSVADHVLPEQIGRAEASMQEHTDLVSQLVFSPRPVLVEGPTDVAALSTTLARTHPREAVAQTDLVPCGGSQAVALWFEVARSLGLSVRAIADLDAAFDPAVRRAMDAAQSVLARYREDLAAEPPRSSTVLAPLTEELGRLGVPADPRSRAKGLLNLQGGHASRRDKLLDIWRDAGLWLHPEGSLEQVLGIDKKGVGPAREAASISSGLDRAAAWAAFSLDTRADVEALLGAEVERIAHAILEALRLDPDAAFEAPVGPTATADSELVAVRPLGNGTHEIVVRAPDAYSGMWLRFDRSTRPSDLRLLPRRPEEPAEGSASGLGNDEGGLPALAAD